MYCWCSDLSRGYSREGHVDRDLRESADERHHRLVIRDAGEVDLQTSRVLLLRLPLVHLDWLLLVQGAKIIVQVPAAVLASLDDTDSCHHLHNLIPLAGLKNGWFEFVSHVVALLHMLFFALFYAVILHPTLLFVKRL